MKNFKIALVLFFTFLSYFGFTQGKVSGTVIDGDFNEPMAFANKVGQGYRELVCFNIMVIAYLQILPKPPPIKTHSNSLIMTPLFSGTVAIR